MSKLDSRVTILAFSYVKGDIGVLRQVEYLSRIMPVSVIGYGEPISGPNVNMVSLSRDSETIWQKVMRRIETGKVIQPPYKLYRKILLMLGQKLSPAFYERLYWHTEDHSLAYQELLKSQAKVLLVHNWTGLPVGVKAARELNAQVVVYLAEFAPEEYSQRPEWKANTLPLINHILHTYLPEVFAAFTVNQPISDKYFQDYGVRPLVVMNAPQYNPGICFHPTDPQKIHLVHHGAAFPDRELEKMLDILALTDNRYCLHFMLVGNPDYQNKLKERANQVVPGRVFFEDPVSPAGILQRISSYDLGIHILPAVNQNHYLALPNKFFEFVNAGLGVCIGPSPEMARLANQYGFGVVSPSFDVVAVADVLNDLTTEMIDEMKRKALEASKCLNADVEMEKMVNLIRKCVGEA